MRKRVNGLVYDTDKSTLLWQDNDERRSYYETKNGRFFIMYKTGEIDPISEDRVRDVLIEYAYNVYVKRFGEPEEA
jgi:hypothetical protein